MKRIIFAALLITAMIFPLNASAATWNPYRGMWLTRAELDSLPTTGTAWNNVVKIATSSWGTAQISNQDSLHDTNTLAGALYAARTGDTVMRTKTANAIMSAVNTEKGGRVLALARNLPSYVISADLINLPAYNASMGNTFANWLASVRTESMTECGTLISCSNSRPNNWGTHALGARIAADVYLNDTVELDKAAKTFKGWLGDRSSYSGFKYGDLSWQCNSSLPVGINQGNCSNANKSSILPDDMRRGGSYKIPPGHTDYPWGALEGAVISAELLSRVGYPAWSWGFNTLNDSAIKRAMQKLDVFNTLYGGWWASGDDVATVWIAEHAYHAGFRTVTPVRAGKSIGFTDWTFNR